VTREISLDRFAAPAREALALVAAVAGAGPGAWVVGGTLRDLLLGEPCLDLDLAVPSGALALGRALADRRGAAFVLLDEARGACRVVDGLQIDVTDFRGPLLADDLRARDFTVNALAVSVPALVASDRAPVVDPTGGLDDLVTRTVRLCSERAIAEDPVRALRAVRLALRPGWALDEGVEAAIRAAAPAMASVSAERIRDELIGILGEPRAGRGLRVLDDLGVLPVLLPESRAMRETEQPPPHQYDVWEHSLRAVDAADGILARLDRLEERSETVAAHLAEDLGDGLTRARVLKLAALLHDVAKPETRALDGDRVRFIGHDVRGAERANEIARRWRLSGRAASVLVRLVRQHLRPMHLAQAEGVTRRARYRFFRDLGDDAYDCLLLALADAAALRGDPPWQVWTEAGGAVIRALLAGMAEETTAAAVPPLLRGGDVMEAFGLRPGPVVGRLLGVAREAQDLGLVRTREEALAYLRAREAALPGGAGDAAR
jgi:putative nucleotidyltransferase with HDIG domain